MKRIAPLALLLIASGTLALGQRGFGRGGHSSGHSFSRGGFSRGGFSRGGYVGRGFVGRGFVGRGFVGRGFVGRGYGRPFASFGFGLYSYPRFAYSYPSFYGGYSYYDPFFYGYGYTAYPQPAPQVVIQQDYQALEYRPSRPPEPEYEQPIYLIAFKDHTIQAALAYWVEDGILHFVTRQHEQRQAALEDVDRYFSEELNRTRRLEFRLPR